MKKFWLTLTLLLIQLPAFTQTYRRGEINLENFVEELFAQQKEDQDYEDLYENVLQLLLNPLDLNKASEEDLKSIFILLPHQVRALIAHREKFGKFISIYELQAVEGFDLLLIERLLPFVQVGDENQKQVPFWQRVRESRDAYFIFRVARVLETRRGFTPPDTLSNGRLTSRYLGDPNSLYGRFRIQQAKDFSMGFTIDKDAGEQFIWDRSSQRYGFNFVSYHLTLYNRGKFKAITIGDYQLQVGQGLVFGAGFSPGKGAETITTVRRSTIGIRPYTAALEFGFFRGAAITYRKGLVDFTFLASHLPRDGRLTILPDTLEQERTFISSLQTSGLHRTATEISARRQATESNVGANIHYQSLDRKFQGGINTLFTSFSQPFERNWQRYNQFEFRGQENHLHSAYLGYNFQNHYLFGETAISKSGGSGTVLGLMSSLHPQLAFSMVWRKFDRNFHSFYGNAFSESSRPINETGLYMGLNYKANNRWSMSFYYDYFKFPWLRFRVYAPSSGHEWLGRVQYKPSRKILLFAQLREESKARNLRAVDNTSNFYLLDQGTRYNYVVNLDMGINRHFSMKSRVMGSSFHFNQRTTRGFAISQDLNVDYQRWRISSRFALFDTDDFDNRQFLFERNVLWLFSIPALNGQGLRYYLLGQYKLGDRITCWARFARTIFTDRELIGSGLQQIQGNQQTEVVFQVRYQFLR
ncbi:ComEA family DNA-binding protein [Mongoliitalea daihaiensis]|uniref:ComEA family DNA-binding protein n=1 Tax=Mongoliitalea daihaiensis TaxID=2782006 RepID=UPI001F30B818|nr:helix-hairpin-helix domain-containing protein [Mongoliitalea daihaiensis]UJP64614.1 helix-hairpin-helix domain-containing protein [Mongoliitalea daihaiensis]